MQHLVCEVGKEGLDMGVENWEGVVEIVGCVWIVLWEDEKG